MKTIVILDNGHGEDTPGKCSPDKTIREYKYCREIVKRISSTLEALGIPFVVLVPEENDIPLAERVKRANAINRKARTEGDKTILISVHLNAAGNGDWKFARGFSVWVANTASDNSKKLATMFTKNALQMNLKGNRSIPKEQYWSSNFYILKNTNMPAVLTENMFQDNREDVKWLLSEEGKKTIVDLHIKTIQEYLSE